jgi:mRNA interferase RelE/StbE
MFRVIYGRKVYKDLDPIPDRDVERITDVFKALAQNPRPMGCEKLSGHPSWYRIRRGDYRIVYAMDSKSRVIKILFVKHRKDVYRRL